MVELAGVFVEAVVDDEDGEVIDDENEDVIDEEEEADPLDAE